MSFSKALFVAVFIIALTSAEDVEQIKCPLWKFGVSRFVCPKTVDGQGYCSFYKVEGASADAPLMQKAASNTCTACSNKPEYYIKGSCPGQTVHCDQFARPQACSRIYSPVCAHKTDCQGDQCQVTLSSPCVACGTEGIEYYTRGVCN